jgi:putative ABC transport system permease protein
MIRSYLKIAFRNLSRRKGYAVMNIAGLAIGITCSLLIFEYVAYERSFDKFHKDADRIVRVQDEEHQQGIMVVACAAGMPGIAPFMKKEFPEVEDACRLRKISQLISNDSRNIAFREPDIYYADQSILQIFTLPLEKGNQLTALKDPGKVILSAATANKYFGSEDPVGKVLTIHAEGSSRPLEVTGVFKDYPVNSHLKLTVLISYPTYSQINGTYGKPNDILENNFGWTDFYTYLLLRKGSSEQQVAAKLPAFIDRHYNDLPENKARNDSYSLSLMPLKDIHLYSHYTEEAEANGDGRSVSFLFMISFFIIIIAWVNYINLATARSLERAREVGMRKVMGALRGELIRQFMLESFLLNMLALILAIIITLAVNPLFSQLTGRNLPSFLHLPFNYSFSFIGLFVTGTFLSGIYPALVLSRYRPVLVLKGAFKNVAGGQWLRKGLIVGQFAASITLIAGTMIVYRQLHYMQDQDLGADISQTLVVKGGGNNIADSVYPGTFAAFKQELLRVGGVKNITASSGIMGDEILWSTDWHILKGGNRQAVNLFHLGVDGEFTGSYGLRLIAGAPFSKSAGDNNKKVILNETAVRAFGFPSPKAALGEMISGGQNDMDSQIVSGVIADYHNEGLQKTVQPLVLLPDRGSHNFYSVKIEEHSAVPALAGVKKIWDKYFPGDPYEYFFLDEFFNRQYAEDKRFGEVFGLFAVLAIAIACFGLLGLSAYNVLQRTKEIGVRKVLGASVQGLLFTLSKDFLILVIIAFVIAIPVTWFAMSSWLQGFAYRTAISWWVFAAAGILSILIALFTVVFQALKAALANPVVSLRTDG